MNYDRKISEFKFALLRAMPFYGEILLRVPIVARKDIGTACTDGRTIEYNPHFFDRLSPGERNFVIMHEVMHIILRHYARRGNRNPRIWNTAADLIVNNTLISMMKSLNEKGIRFNKPQDGIYGQVYTYDTTEKIYSALCEKNDEKDENINKILIETGWKKFSHVEPHDDIIETAASSGAQDGQELSDVPMRSLIKDLLNKYAGRERSIFLPAEVKGALQGKRVKWDRLLRQFMTEEMSEESSYLTPERKYLHMDLIVPGLGTHNSKIESIWAFVDSSGSISEGEMKEFLFQLRTITKAFKCTMNIAYWDTSVNGVYKNIRTPGEIEKCLPQSMGGTDINCVYSWIRETRTKPDVMLILTDGEFGALDSTVFIPGLKRKTVLVINNDSIYSDDFKRIGKVTSI